MLSNNQCDFNSNILECDNNNIIKNKTNMKNNIDNHDNISIPTNDLNYIIPKIMKSKSELKVNNTLSNSSSLFNKIGHVKKIKHSYNHVLSKSIFSNNLNKALYIPSNKSTIAISNEMYNNLEINCKEVISSKSDNEHQLVLKIKDRWLPLANISKIMKLSVPEMAKIAKDAKLIIQNSASEFIAIVTCKAKDIAVSESRKAITGDDLIRAMAELDMPYLSSITKVYFDQYKKTTNTYASMYFDQNDKFLNNKC